jgi:2-hydroxychromene-2-carboxylate isomerase
LKSLEVFIDFKSPAAYLALQPTLKLAEELHMAIDWRPIPTKQTAIPVETPDEDVSARHRRVRAIARQRTHLHYATVQGITMQFPPQPGDTDFALAILDNLQERRDDFVQAAFNAYWAGAQNLNDPGVVAALVNEIDAIMPEACDVAAVVAQCHQRAIEDGVIDAPGYKLDEKIFIGREHLPWIRQILQKRLHPGGDTRAE